MSTVTMNISLTEDLKAFVDTRVKSRGYSSSSEYVRDLLRRDEERAGEERFQKLIQDGLESPLLPESFDLAAHMRGRILAGQQQPSARNARRA
jgi:antitoxin ParD1/3/4